MGRAETGSVKGPRKESRLETASPAVRLSDSTDNSEAPLIQKCLKGDSEAWSQFVAKFERLIFSIALRICRDREVAADVTQQVFLQVYQQLDGLTGVSNLRAWIATIARRRAFDHLRSARPFEPLPEEECEDSTDDFSRLQERHALETALAKLPKRLQQLIEMLYMSPDCPTYEEVAQKLEMPVSSIGPTRIRALRKLKDLLS